MLADPGTLLLSLCRSLFSSAVVKAQTKARPSVRRKQPQYCRGTRTFQDQMKDDEMRAHFDGRSRVGLLPGT
ncbi:hypothetical protein GCM10017668_52060 [Streptomyces tuirus]|uniref:Uncharacterized protein n=1 Tax=Streptomyces tuirus TaxID=68278 RepID=A0A7G1NJF7_9ACTN|nr:hypothetical protein GCM10017668_52060 [Streptomyces tuirus]